ncbi:MAG: right-handed parallel beta-helix repeat-containing protein [Nibricoccus sp.]
MYTTQTPTQHRWLKTISVFAAGALFSVAHAANYTVSTPATIKSQIQAAVSGDVITIQSGTYNMSGLAPINLTANGVTVVGSSVTLDFKATATTDVRGIQIIGDNNYIRGLTINNAPDNGIHISGDGNTVERCTFNTCFDTGLEISKGTGGTAPANNKVINCDSYNNYDSKKAGSMADGFAAKTGIGSGNSFKGCRATGNSDDAFDFFAGDGTAAAAVTVSYCIAATSGKDTGNGNGFKLGSAYTTTSNSAHKIDHCIAYKNLKKGFDQNHNKSPVTMSYCTGASNGSYNFAFGEFTNGGTFTKNVSTGTWDVKGTQSGNLTSVSTSAFTSTSLSAVTRDGSGNLLFNNFMKYANSGGAGANP